MLDALASHLDSIAALAPVWGFLFVFIFMTVESSFIPFPSEIVMIPAGFMAARGELTTGNPICDLTIAIIAGTAGSLAGAYANYYLALKLGKPFLQKYGKWFFIKQKLSIVRVRFLTNTAALQHSPAASSPLSVN